MLNIYRAIETNLLSQSFGENAPCVKLDSTGKPIRPFIVQTFPIGDGHGGVVWNTPTGWAKFYPLIGLSGHNGQDWRSYNGEPVYFNITQPNGVSVQGTCYTEIDPDGGKGVNIVFCDAPTGEWFQTKYWHLKDQLVHDGQVVKSGDQIGLADSTGASSGDHLHFSLKPLNSSNLEDKKFPNNGFTGAMNTETYPNIRDYQKTDFILTILNLTQQLTLLQQIVKLLALLKGRKHIR